jgi:hypothetical protein
MEIKKGIGSPWITIASTIKRTLGIFSPHTDYGGKGMNE